MPKVSVTSLKEPLFKQEIQAGSHKLVSDAPRDVGGSETAPDPHELLLAALGACTSMTMQIFAERRKWDLQKVHVELTEEKVDDPENPGRQMSKITRSITVEGDLSPEQVDNLKAVANKCPIHKILTGSKEIVTTIAHG